MSVTIKKSFASRAAFLLFAVSGVSACSTGGLEFDANVNPSSLGAEENTAPNASSGPCIEGGDFNVLAGLFSGSSRRYNDECGFLSAVNAIYNNPESSADEKAVALRAWANRDEEFAEVLENVARAIEEGRDPVFYALRDGIIQCVAGPQTGTTPDGRRVHNLEGCDPA